MNTTRTCFPPLPAGTHEFEETRPALYYAADRWSHLPDARPRDRRAANDARRPVVVERIEPATTPGGRPERRAGWAPLGLLSIVAGATVALLGIAAAALDAGHLPERTHVASASN